MRVLTRFGRAYPGRSAAILFSLLLAGVAEGIGLTALLPLLSVALGPRGGSGAGNASVGGGLGRTVQDALAGLGLPPTVGVLLAVILVAIVFKSGLLMLANRQVGYAVASVATDLRLALLRALLLARWEYFLRKPVGALANSVATEAMRASAAYLSGATMAALLVQAVVYGGVALVVSWRATAASLAAGMLLLYALNRFVQTSRRAGARQTRLLISLIGRLTDILQSVKPLKSMARERLADSLLESETRKLNRALQKEVFSREALRAFQEPMLAALVAVGLYAALVIWNLPLASVMVLVFLLARLLIQLGKVQREYQKMAANESAYWSLEGLIREAQQGRETTTGDTEPRLDRGIRLEGVDFAYGELPVLRNATLSIPAGLLTAIVGPSGGGKTTVADLVTGLLRPQAGEVWIDDVPLSRVDLRKWRRRIGYVPQETLLLHDSVLNNVTLGDPEIRPEDAEYALRAAEAWEFVSAMPQGIHSTVGERGGNLSGGQRQRIAISRALAHRPVLLILDEATTALDPASEEAILATLRQLRGTLTILAISHQPALVGVADRVYRVEDGTVVPVEVARRGEERVAVSERGEHPGGA